jgi:hypothetical protein
MATHRITETGAAGILGQEGLTGRAGDLRRIDGFLRSLDAAGSALVICGEAGVGKTALLAAAAARAARAVVRTLTATGTQFEAQTGFGTLQQLLEPVLGELGTLDPSHREVLAVALGRGSGPAPAVEAVARAVVGLLGRLTRERPLLLVLDDLQWMDPTSALVLGLVARRLLGTGAGLLAADRGDADNYFDSTGCSVHVLEPLDDEAADALLVARFPVLARRVRQRLRAEARGNPLALLELPVALTGSAQHAAATGAGALLPPLSLTRRLQVAFASRVTSLPAPTRYLLLLAALEGTGDMRLLQAAVAGRCSLKHLGPAERAQLVRVDDQAGRLYFRHPLTRLAIVDLSTSDQRRSAHLALARPLADQPERHAWHLGQAAVGPDEDVAAQLERAAQSMSRHGDGARAIAALLRAADLSPEPARRAGRLVSAAYLGVHVTGDLHQVPRLLDDAQRFAEQGDDGLGESNRTGPGPLLAAVASSAYLLNGSGDIDTAHRLLSEAVALHPQPCDPQDEILAEALHTLMLICFFSGRQELWQPVDATLAGLADDDGMLAVTRGTFADPVRSTPSQRAHLDQAVAQLAYESNPARPAGGTPPSSTPTTTCPRDTCSGPRKPDPQWPA